MIRTACLLVFLSGCASAAPAPLAPVTPAEPPSLLGDAEPRPRSSVETAQERMLCQGTCPADIFSAPVPLVEVTLERPWYTVKLRGDGTALFLGASFENGRVVDHVQPAEVQALARRFDGLGIQFDHVGQLDLSNQQHFDGPGMTTLSLVRGGRRTQMIVCSPNHWLAEEIDRIAGTRGRMRCGTGNLPPCETSRGATQ